MCLTSEWSVWVNAAEFWNDFEQSLTNFEVINFVSEIQVECMPSFADV